MKKKQFTCNILCAMALLGATMTVYADDVTTQEATPVIIPKAQLAPITITGTRYIESDTFAGGYLEKKANFGVLGERSIMETPFNMTAMTAKTMDDIQANNIVDVAAMDASVNNQTLGGASQAWAIRGFRSQQQDVALNGLYGIAPRFYTGTEALESVEILKGASALLYGMAPNGSVGGTINYVPKRASSEPNSNSFKVTYGDGKQFGKQLDYGVRTNDDKWGFHTTLYQTNGSTSYTNEQIKTQSAAVNVDRKGSHSKFSLDLGYAYNDVENPQYRVSFDDAYLENIQKLGLPTADHNKTYGAPGTFRHVTEKYGMARYDYDFNKY
ncbi:MAG: TonB-dependent receptor plug domain-containing protein, partial [Veillonella sp.]|nr:TonB-dependent receptor plug domain-containing protein [Veillonella sp.]